ncbi:MAG: AIR synthase related protein, partial [Dehalococcoidia bacterium]
MGVIEYNYRAAGVDINTAEEAVRLIRRHARTTHDSRVLGDIGFFGGLFRLGEYRNPILVSSTDGVGTKVRIASLLNRYDTVGIDLVNHCVNDILVCGACPLFFLDYMAMGRLEPAKAGALAKGLASACCEVRCALVGGETAEMPGIYSGE